MPFYHFYGDYGEEADNDGTESPPSGGFEYEGASCQFKTDELDGVPALTLKLLLSIGVAAAKTIQMGKVMSSTSRASIHRLRRFSLLCGLALLLLPVLAGCSATHLPATPPAGDGKAYLVDLPGVSGQLPTQQGWFSALKAGGVVADMEAFDWTDHLGWIGALQAYQHNKDQAQKVADRIAERQRADPDQPVLVTASSGGTGIALWALERLPPGMQVDSIVLIAPAVSPDYDMSAALRHVHGRMYVVTSPLDVLILGAGTTVFGTTDGIHSAAAGQIGFRMPAGADPVQYEKVLAMPWRLDWIAHGNFGDHVGGVSFPFARDVLAPILCSEIRKRSG